jgi:two-component system, response regulator PdtaR
LDRQEHRLTPSIILTDLYIFIIAGSLDGVIMMHHYPETAIAIGNSVCQNMFDEAYGFEVINDDLRNALAEWGITIVGRSTDLHSRHKLAYGFSSPYFVEDQTEWINI